MNNQLGSHESGMIQVEVADEAIQAEQQPSMFVAEESVAMNSMAARFRLVHASPTGWYHFTPDQFGHGR